MRRQTRANVLEGDLRLVRECRRDRPVRAHPARAYLRAFIDPIALGPAPFALAATLGIAWLAVGAQTVRAARLKPADVLRNE